LRSACEAVEPADTGDRSRTDKGIMTAKTYSYG
jgi:hypothetical protein